MKKTLLTLSFTAIGLLMNAQINLYEKLKKMIVETHPEIKLENRLIAFNTWSVDNSESREANKSFEKVCSVYEFARLKGGSKGIIVVAINKDNLSSTANITYTKDGISKLISVKLEDLAGGETITDSNGVFDSSGNEIYRNLSSENIYSSINHLITR